MPTNTIRLHRVLRAAPEKIYRAFLDADAMAKWLPPNGFTGKVHHLEAKVGGTHKMSFTNFATGQSHSFGGNVSRTRAARTHSLHRQIRRPESARGTSGHRNLQEGIGRDRVERRTGRGARGHPARGLLSRLAGIAHAFGQTCRSRYSRLTPGKNRLAGAAPAGFRRTAGRDILETSSFLAVGRPRRLSPISTRNSENGRLRAGAHW